MPPGKWSGIGSKISVVDLSTRLVAAGRENRGFALPCVECSGYYSAEHLTPGLTFRHAKCHHGLQKDNDCSKSSPSYFSTHKVIYMIMAFSS